MTNYVNATEFKDKICEFKKSGKISESLGLDLMNMCKGIGAKYKAHDDAVSDCILKSIKALDYIDCRRKPSWIFNYITSVIFNHYRRMYVENARQLNNFEKFCRNEYGIEISELHWESI